MNNFYKATIEEITSSSLSAIITFDKQHDIFRGHFPGQLVVPGVCLVEIIKELLQHTTNKQLALSIASQVKFLQLVTPEMTLTCQISWKTEGSKIVANATMDMDKAVFKLSGLYVES